MNTPGDLKRTERAERSQRSSLLFLGNHSEATSITLDAKIIRSWKLGADQKWQLPAQAWLETARHLGAVWALSRKQRISRLLVPPSISLY